MKILMRVLCMCIALSMTAGIMPIDQETTAGNMAANHGTTAGTISPDQDTSPSRGAIRVGYVESEEYYAFANGLAGIGAALRELGVIDRFDVDIDAADSRKVWQALTEAGGGGLVFVPELHFCMKSMDEADYARFTNNKEVDLMLVMGTVAGVYFTENETKNDYMVFAAANPIRSGIVKSGEERFKPNSYAYIDSSRFRRQIEIAYNIFHFDTIGVVYEDNEHAYAYSGIDQLEASAEANSFEILRLHVDESKGVLDDERYYAELKDAYGQLARQADTLYITTATTADDKLRWLLEDIYAAGVATVSQVGESQVHNGAVLGVTLDDPKDQGRFIAAQLARYTGGEPVDRLDQVYEITPKFFLNYDAALDTGLQIPMRTWLMADVIYRREEEEK